MTQGDDSTRAVIDRYLRFALDEAPGRSALYAEWAAGVAGNPEIAAILARIAPTHRQPPLVFAVTRLLGAPETDFAGWARWLGENADAVVAECAMRSIQTNEPLRCAALLPALSLIEGPIALLEVGASAGLCLYPDRYSYCYRLDDATVVALDPESGQSEVVLVSELRGNARPRIRMPQIVWRAGIDLRPLSATDSVDRAWLTGLVWPGETGRVERVRAALDIAASDSPLLIAGDAVDMLPDLAASAPPGATLVVTTPGVLAHVPWAARHTLIDVARAVGRWITIDAPGLHEGWNEPIDIAVWPADAFALALDGRVLAAVDPLGGFVEWRAESEGQPG
ncbi:MAG: DUF2332 domain-containing protein [Actinobacteria bacterium]|nr:DUF2332 domain-containing protein [Actinomycetota bacterium]